MSLFEAPDFDTAAAAVRGKCETAVLTRSEKGSVVLQDGKTYEQRAERVKQVVDTTGAGDLYAAGYLYGYTRGLSPSESARIGSIAAAEVIGHFGARPEVELKTLL